MNPLVVVQVLLYNEDFNSIEQLLSSIELVDYPKERWRLVIINNLCPGHDIQRYFENNWRHKVGETLPETVFISQENNGFAGGHVDAFQIAKTFHPDYIYLLNGDAVVDHQFLWRVVQAAESHPNAALIQSRIMLEPDRSRANSLGNAMHFLGFGFTITEPQSGLKVFYASGAGVLVRTSMVPGELFDPLYFMYHEDLDLGWRMRLAGHVIIVADDSIIYHHYEFSKSITKFYWMERNRHLTNLSNYKLGTLALIAPAALLVELGTLVFAIKSGWWKEKLKSWAYFLQPSTWLWIWRRRYEVDGFRRVSDREILSHTVGVIVNQEIENPVVTKFVNPLMSIYLRGIRFFVRW